MATAKQLRALQELKDTLDIPVVKRQEEAYCMDDYYAIEAAARDLVKAFGLTLEPLQEEA